MDLYGLTLDFERCPDGVELVDLPAIEGPTLASSWSARDGVSLYRTIRRERRQIELTNLEDPVAIKFVNPPMTPSGSYFSGNSELVGTVGAMPEDHPHRKTRALPT